MAVYELPAETLDGVKVTLRANIEKPDEVVLVKQYRADGVGLYRTEFLFLSATRVPTEEQQYAAYREIVAGLAPAPGTIRTLDVGGDKPLPGDPHLIGPEANPFLGFRAIRMCLQNPEIFKNQLRAILRATAPSAARAGDFRAGRCSFFSIGPNDLNHFLLATARSNSRIAHLYDPSHPAVLRVLKQIVNTGHERQLKVSVCGEMAGDAIYAPLLVGLGVDELSMTPTLLPAVKFIIRATKMSDARQLAADALKQTDPKKTYALIEAFYNERVKVE